jgi:hypothetical protein
MREFTRVKSQGNDHSKWATPMRPIVPMITWGRRVIMPKPAMRTERLQYVRASKVPATPRIELRKTNKKIQYATKKEPRKSANQGRCHGTGDRASPTELIRFQRLPKDTKAMGLGFSVSYVTMLLKTGLDRLLKRPRHRGQSKRTSMAFGDEVNVTNQVV